MFIDACIEAGNKHAGQKIDGNMHCMGMVIGQLGNLMARDMEGLSRRLEKMAIESDARKARESGVQGSGLRSTEEGNRSHVGPGSSPVEEGTTEMFVSGY